MRHLACITCGKEKLTRNAQRKELCGSCANKGKIISEEARMRMSEAHKGKIASKETRYKMSISRGGIGEEQRYPGLGAWSSRNRSKTPFCEWCYSEDNLEAHHIMPKARFPQYATDDSNCRVMCAPCHIACHKQGGF
jgi:hypothetical protein